MARRFSKALKKRKKSQKLTKMIQKSKENKKTIIAKKVRDAKQYVKNLSSYKLNDNEILLLAKGVKFIPTPKIERSVKKLMNDFSEYERRMRCSFLFEDGNETSIHPFYQKSGFKPNYSCEALENYLFATKYELSKIKPRRGRPNLTKEEIHGLQSLIRNDTILIQKADKCSTICVLNKTNYINEGLRQLENKTYYEEVHTSQMNNVTLFVTELIENAHKGKQLDDITYHYLLKNINSEKLGRFFMLPKIHKIPANVLKELETNDDLRSQFLITGRPIVSLCGTPLHNIGHFIDFIILPIVQQQYTYTRDTKHFIRKIESLSVPNDTILVTCDASNMYTNLEITEILEASSRALETIDRRNFSIKIPTNDIILQLLRTILENNEFTFNEKTYRQKIGVPMGGSSSAELADIRMFEILESILNKFIHKDKILFCTRYRDDIFMLYNGPEHEIHELFCIANDSHKHLKFTYEMSNTEINFLDTLIYKGKRFDTNGTLDMKTYTKPTETFQYLERSSSHNVSVFKGLVKGEIIRHIRNTNDELETRKLIEAFKVRLIRRGYKSAEIDKIIQSTRMIKRTDLLQDKIKSKRKVTVFVTKYNPAIKQLKKLLVKHWKELSNNDRCKQIFQNLPMVAYSRGKNLQELLTKK